MRTTSRRSRRAFERWSERSRHRRFLVPQARLSDDELCYLTEVDHHHHEALVAVDANSGELIGVARYIRSETDRQVAEVAVSVADERQGEGVGGHLVAELAARAREEGIVTFTALALADNKMIVKLLRELGELRVVRRDHANVELSVELARQPRSAHGRSSAVHGQA